MKGDSMAGNWPPSSVSLTRDCLSCQEKITEKIFHCSPGFNHVAVRSLTP